ncbi:MAG: chemotaxis protein CheX [Phycisphaerales bacterium]
MDPNLITPFISSVQHVFSTMFQLPVEVGTPSIKQGRECTHDISAIISMSGEFQGNVVLSMPADAATAIVALFTGERYETDHDDFADAVGEIINMVCGNAKATFQRKNVSISCPSVVIGANHRVAGQSDIPCVLIPCSTDCGELMLEVAIRPVNAEAAAA